MTYPATKKVLFLLIVFVAMICGCETLKNITKPSSSKDSSVAFKTSSVQSKRSGSNIASSAAPEQSTAQEEKIDKSSGMKVGMQFFAPWQGHNFDSKNIVKITGKVKSIKTNQQGMMFIISAVLSTRAKGDIRVDLGPLFYLRTKGLFLAEENRIEVIGSVIKEKNGKEKIVAVEVRKGKKRLKFRDMSGTPLWANVQPRTWRPESQGLPGWSWNQNSGRGQTVKSDSDPNKAYVPDFNKPPVETKEVVETGTKQKAPSVGPDWGSIQQRQEAVRGRVGGAMPSNIGIGTPTSIGN